MNARQQKAKMHARSLRAAKESLMQAVNRQLQSFRAKGYEAEVTPQVLRLLNIEQFRQRDVQQMNRLANNPEKLKEYILAFDSETGEVVSGEVAVSRYNRYATSKIAKPASQVKIVLDNFVDAVEEITTNFDIDEEVEIWIPSRGQSGVPSSISALVHDAEWKLEQLESLLSDLQRGKVA